MFSLLPSHCNGLYRGRLKLFSPSNFAPGLVHFVTTVAYHFYLALPAAFTQPGDHFLAYPIPKEGMHADRELNLHLGWPWGWGPTDPIDQSLIFCLLFLPSAQFSHAGYSISRLLFKIPFCANLLPNLPESDAKLKIAPLYCMSNASCKVVIQQWHAIMGPCINHVFGILDPLLPPCQYQIHATSLPLVRNCPTLPPPSLLTSFMYGPMQNCK